MCSRASRAWRRTMSARLHHDDGDSGLHRGDGEAVAIAAMGMGIAGLHHGDGEAVRELLAVVWPSAELLGVCSPVGWSRQPA